MTRTSKSVLWSQSCRGKCLLNDLCLLPSLILSFSRLQDETARIEDELVKGPALDALLRCFVNSKAISFENLLDPFWKICRISNPVTIGVAKSQFFKRIIEKLDHSKPLVRINLLRILRTVCDVHPNRVMLVERFRIYDIVSKLSNDDQAVLVREMARDILPTLAPALKPSSSRVNKGFDTPKSALAPKKKMRRTASESAAAVSPMFPNTHIRSATRPIGVSNRMTRQLPSDTSFQSGSSYIGSPPR